MEIEIYRVSSLAKASYGWLKKTHSFSFANYIHSEKRFFKIQGQYGEWFFN
jgi:hypothetical protein